MTQDRYIEYKKKECRYCDKPLPEAFLDLGVLPLANSFVRKEDAAKEEFRCPLRLTLCSSCFLVQLSHVVPPDMMFSNYLYVSSTTKTFRDHFAEYAASVRKKCAKKEKGVAVDIGSNDGLLLACYQKEGFRAVGVDPATNLAEAANKNGTPTINRYFDETSVNMILKEYGPADAVSANNVFAHIDDIHSVCRNVSKLLAPAGIFSIEFPYLVTMLDELLFDMVYHEHLSYIGVNALTYVLKRHSLEIFDIQQVSSHGGSLRVFIQKQGGPQKEAAIVGELREKEKQRGCLNESAYRDFAARVMDAKEQFMELVRETRAAGKTMGGYGAPAKASTIINYYGLTKDDILFAVDDNPMKQNLLIPGSQIPIVPSSCLMDNPPDYVVIFAWNFAAEILQKIGHLREKGVQFVTPFLEQKKI